MPNSDSNDITRSHVQLAHGSIIGHYRIIERIGAGGMGEVYLAEDSELNRKVALKFLPLHLCQDADCRARFKREAQAAAKLNHPNIITIYEVSEFNGRPFFAMEYIEGQTLRDFGKDKEQPLSRTIELAIQVCDGLAQAHSAGIVHRDIKPSNILIDQDGRVKIVDFGLASVHGSEHLTKTGSTLGTIGYMSPEQARGEEVDARSDLFSFGVVLYELITGRSPFKAESEIATIKNVIEAVPEPLARYKAGMPDDLQRVIDKLLFKDRSLRYQHADDIATDLKRLSTAANSPRTPRRGLWSRYVVTAAVAVVLIVAGYWGATKFQTKEVQKIEPARKMLAVLPFENLSPDPDQEYFSDGLTEELTSRLSLIQSLCVISRSSSMTFKGSNKTIPEITRALGVQYIVEGSVRKSGNELRITAQLIDANADAHIWSRSYTGTLADVFDMQDSVSQSIVDGIKIQLTPDETRRVKKRGVDDVDAYVLYLKGVNGIYEGTADALRKGLRSLEQSQAIIGDNALLYSGMAWGLYMLVNNGLGQEEDIAACEEYAKKALTLDPELPEAHAMLGWINSSFLGNQAQAVQHFKTALILDPNSENALWGLAVVYFMNVGRVSEALALSEKYLLLNPQDSLQLYIQRGDLQFYAGDFPQALVWLRKSYLAGNRQPIDILMYAMAFAACDSVEEAIVVLNEANRTDSSSAIADFDQVLLFALRNDLSSALGALSSELQRTCRRDAGWSYTLGAVLAKAGATEEALAWMENGVSRGFSNYPFMQKDPFLNNLRSDDRFKRLMERVKYEWEHFEA